MGATQTRKETEAGGDEWMSLNEAARELGINRATVLNRIVGGQLTGMVAAGRTLVSRASIAAAKRAKATK